MRKRRSFQRTIRNTIFFWALAPLLVLAAAGVLLTRTALYQSTQTHLTEVCRKTALLMENVCKEYTRELSGLAEQDALQEQLRSGSIPTERYSSLYAFVNGASVRADFYLLDASYRILGASTTTIPSFLTDSGVKTSLVWQRERRTPGETVIAGDNAGGSERLLFACRIGETLSPAGYVAFELSWEDVRACIPETEHCIMADRYHYAFFSTDTLLLDSYRRVVNDARFNCGRLSSEGRQLSLVSTDVFDGEMTVYTYADTTVYLSVYQVLIPSLAVLFTGLVAFLIPASRRVARRTGMVVDRIAQAMENTQYDTLSETLCINTGDEFEKIAQSYNRMCAEIRRLIDDNAESCRQQALSEIKQLESQFNPHFLFNTLETVRVLIKIDPEEARRDILSLSELLRYSINNTLESVPLLEDIRYTEAYLQIQKSRFGRRLSYSVEIDPEAKGCIVPKLILQPLVENAIQYGRDAEGNCCVRIAVTAQENRLTIAVYASGAPLDEQERRRIARLIEEPRNETIHIGLYNIHRRIRLRFGEEYGVVFRANEGSGGNVFSVTLPMRTKEVKHV